MYVAVAIVVVALVAVAFYYLFYKPGDNGEGNGDGDQEHEFVWGDSLEYGLSFGDIQGILWLNVSAVAQSTYLIDMWFNQDNGSSDFNRTSIDKDAQVLFPGIGDFNFPELEDSWFVEHFDNKTFISTNFGEKFVDKYVIDDVQFYVGVDDRILYLLVQGGTGSPGFLELIDTNVNWI